MMRVFWKCHNLTLIIDGIVKTNRMPIRGVYWGKKYDFFSINFHLNFYLLQYFDLNCYLSENVISAQSQATISVFVSLWFSILSILFQLNKKGKTWWIKLDLKKSDEVPNSGKQKGIVRWWSVFVHSKLDHHLNQKTLFILTHKPNGLGF
jgi:hypothetical protein